MNVLLLGPPGSGKGTQGVRVARRFGLEHIATGDLLRAEVAGGSPVGERASAYMRAGELVPDEVILDLVMPRVLAAAAAGGYVLDGFPRSVIQAQAARALAEQVGASPHVVVYLDVPAAELTRRMLGRARVQGRVDDTAETIGHRLEVFGEVTRPLVEHYRERGLLRTVDGSRQPNAVFSAIEAIVAALPGR